jgi:hypothetical protein
MAGRMHDPFEIDWFYLAKAPRVDRHRLVTGLLRRRGMSQLLATEVRNALIACTIMGVQ